MTLSVESLQAQPGRPRRRLVRLTALGVTVGVAVAAMVTAGGGSAGAATPISQSEGRFLTGTAAGQSFDSVAALTGEMAEYPGNPGPNQNDLAGSVLGQALTSPLGNGTVPFPGGVTFGAVGQFAQANKDGSASASSGLIGSNGAINVGGSGNSDLATIDLAGLPGATPLTNVLGDLTLKIGAVSGRARQAAFGKKLADPAADCTSGTYERVSHTNHAGSYQFANLTLSATSPLLALLGSTLTTTLGTAISNFSTTVAAAPGGLISVSGLPTAAELAQDFTVSVAGGGVSANLTNGSLTIDLAKILMAAGLDINNLCPNTSLGSYLASALAKLPAAIDALVTGLTSELTTALGAVTLTVGGTALTGSTLTGQLNPLIAAVTGPLTSNLATVTSALNAALEPAIAAVSDNLLALTANTQRESNGIFTEAALVLRLLPNGGSLPTVPGLPTLPALPTAPTSGLPVTGLPALPSGTTIPSLRRSAAKRAAPAESSSAKPQSFASVRLVSARLAPLAAPAATGTPALQLNLGLAAVTNNEPANVSPTSTTPPSNSVSGTEIPTGVPAGAAGHGGGGSPALPIVLVLIGLVLAGGGVTVYRGRGKFSH